MSDTAEELLKEAIRMLRWQTPVGADTWANWVWKAVAVLNVYNERRQMVEGDL